VRQEDFIPTIIAYENGKLTHEEIVEFFQLGVTGRPLPSNRKT
jgi:hypothetical protein